MDLRYGPIFRNISYGVSYSPNHMQSGKPSLDRRGLAALKPHDPLCDLYEDKAQRNQIAGDHGSPPPDAEWRLDPPRSDECCRQEKNDGCEEVRSIGNGHDVSLTFAGGARLARSTMLTAPGRRV
jgi:hypothetical protein